MHKRVFKGNGWIASSLDNGWNTQIITAKINKETIEDEAITKINVKFGIGKNDYMIIRKENKKNIRLTFLKF